MPTAKFTFTPLGNFKNFKNIKIQPNCRLILYKTIEFDERRKIKKYMTIISFKEDKNIHFSQTFNGFTNIKYTFVGDFQHLFSKPKRRWPLSWGLIDEKLPYPKIKTYSTI